MGSGKFAFHDHTAAHVVFFRSSGDSLIMVILTPLDWELRKLCLLVFENSTGSHVRPGLPKVLTILLIGCPRF